MKRCPLCRDRGDWLVVVGTPRYGRVALEFAAQHSGFTVAELREGTRHFKRVRTRVAAAMVMRDHGGMSWHATGKAISRSHHSVIASIKSHGEDRDVIHLVGLIDKSMREAVGDGT